MLKKVLLAMVVVLMLAVITRAGEYVVNFIPSVYGSNESDSNFCDADYSLGTWDTSGGSISGYANTFLLGSGASNQYKNVWATSWVGGNVVVSWQGGGTPPGAWVWIDCTHSYDAAANGSVWGNGDGYVSGDTEAGCTYVGNYSQVHCQGYANTFQDDASANAYYNATNREDYVPYVDDYYADPSGKYYYSREYGYYPIEDMCYGLDPGDPNDTVSLWIAFSIDSESTFHYSSGDNPYWYVVSDAAASLTCSINIQER